MKIWSSILGVTAFMVLLASTWYTRADDMTGAGSVSRSGPQAVCLQFDDSANGDSPKRESAQAEMETRLRLVGCESSEDSIRQPYLNFYLVPAPRLFLNGQSRNMSVSPQTDVSLAIGLDANSFQGRMADWWLWVDSSLGVFSYVYPSGFVPGNLPAIQAPIQSIADGFVVHMGKLPVGVYDIGFAVDDNADGVRDATWETGIRLDVLASLVIQQGKWSGRQDDATFNLTVAGRKVTESSLYIDSPGAFNIISFGGADIDNANSFRIPYGKETVEGVFINATEALVRVFGREITVKPQ